MPIAVLLITDRPEESQKLERLLSLWGPCGVVDLHRPAKGGPMPARLLVSDVDLSNRVAVEAVRDRVAAHRRKGMPFLCLLRDQSPRLTIQANAIGASAILPAGLPAKTLLDEIGRILNPGGYGAIQQNFIAASAGMADMLSAAAEGRALPVAAIEGSVEAINRAADDRDLGAWLEMVWNHDDATYQHCLLVAGLVAAFARELGFPEEARKQVTSAAVLHDIGKARVPLAILHKAGKLTTEELAIMREHPQIGYEMLLRQGAFAREVVEAARSHHEYLDGTGYPQGLKAHEISDVVRMVTICDIYAALIERRPYKAPMAPQEAYAMLAGMGAKLDGDLLRAFRAMVLPG
ncbi:HDIG domain-containing protein [Bosea sp. 62]|uniref:HD-GYP domain-containing protein n=1 Tax=unclassified Bosea (in: a-proteobacteria) TaxID=2653178 RepID=UPI0012561D3C|nr:MULTISPECIES: HD domain-containing phosphohydrolase [unclassified Bosea (in: a-proteobacteria)]CAD5263875.1 HDIG domain-containing protein [Bosea sp. 46]CAD5266122.1 HDIG domain-containing protein [Bosea sp. 21B]CAD5273531.1 HDIG domain-containing protein [Bosea sp. 7B]VVT56599.1 HDIG domain-containing protein [Bosea sp. EC-HK365B]VXB79085.1 HDIG domain-containing protein [Bosea sp. 29B]